MRLGGAGLGSRVRPGVAQATAGRRRWTQLHAALRRGSPQGDGASEVRRSKRARRRIRSGNVRSAHRSEPVRHEPTAPHRVGTAVRRAPRLGAIVLENRIRELQTSVEWTGVAAGPLPREPGSPSQRVGRPERGGGLAHRALHASDVARMQHRPDRAGTRSIRRDHQPDGSESGDQTQKIVRTIGKCFSRAQRDRHDGRRLGCNDSSAASSPKRRASRGPRWSVTSETSSPEANDRSSNGSGPQRGQRALSWMGSGVGQSDHDEGV